MRVTQARETPSPRSAPPSNPTNGRPRTPAGRGAIPGSRGRSRAGYDGSLRPTRGGSRTPRRGPPSHSLSPPGGGVTRSAPVAAHTGPDAGEPWQRNRVPGRPLPPVGVPMGPRAHGKTPPRDPPRRWCRPKYVRPTSTRPDFRLAIGSRRVPSHPATGLYALGTKNHGLWSDRPVTRLLRGIPCAACVPPTPNAPAPCSLRT